MLKDYRAKKLGNVFTAKSLRKKIIILKGVAETRAGVNPLDLIINHSYSKTSPLLRI